MVIILRRGKPSSVSVRSKTKVNGIPLYDRLPLPDPDNLPKQTPKGDKPQRGVVIIDPDEVEDKGKEDKKPFEVSFVL